MKKLVKKGRYGYLKQQKILAFLGILLMILLGALIFITGILINKGSYKSAFTVIAILAVLPMAKMAVRLIILFPQKSVSEEEDNEVRDIAGEEADVFSSVVITSEEKIMHIDHIVLRSGNCMVLASQNEKNFDYIQEYLTKGVRNWSKSFRIFITKDRKKYITELKGMKDHEDISEREENNVFDYVTSLMV
ncbi:MAG: hypothetical protein VZR00_01415 [Lachnospiraceae bacterium]|nr:hypothetical protein [Lachnospiraceae bacterium]MEE3460535.1 hypothetical protein [Lachnospiraceae bacterium]